MSQQEPTPHVLVVDDLEPGRYLLKVLLEGHGYRVTVAGDGREALAAARRDAPNVIVSDALMPSMDGFSLCREWMDDESLRTIPFVFYSATYTSAEDQRLALALGAVRYLIKPQEPEVFLAELAAVLEQAAINARSPGAAPLNEQTFRTLHNVSLAQKLETKLAQLEATNRNLHESEERFRATFELAAVGIAHVAPDGAWLDVNQRLCDIVGYSREDLLASSFQAITHPDDLATDLEFVRRLLAGEGKSYSLEKRYLRKSGEVVWINLAVRLVRAADGSPGYFISVIEDISERKRLEQRNREQFEELQRREIEGKRLLEMAERSRRALLNAIEDQTRIADALRESEGKFRQLFESSRDALMLQAPPAWRYVDANQAALDLFCVASKADFIALRPLDLSPPTQPDGQASGTKALEVIATAERDGSTFFEWESRRLNGEVFAAEVLLTRIDKEGQRLLQTTVRDITARKTAADQLRQTQEMMASAVSAARVFPWEWDVATDRLSWGVAPELLLGPPSETEPAYPDFRELVLDDDRETFSAAGRNSQSTGAPYYCEFRITATDGTRRWVAARGEAIRGANGQVERLVGSSLDITRQKQAELEIRNLNSTLEERVSQRTAELETANRLLSQAKLEAETANVAKSAFLANMSHEIRTPMNGIVGMVSVLRREGVTGKQVQRLDTIDASVQHLLSVINDILDLSKIEAGKFVLEEAPVDVASLLANVSSIVSERARAKGLRLLVENGCLRHDLAGDSTRLQQALLNYATNAIKFTDKGSVTLRVRQQEDAADTVMLRFEVQDSGIGISAEAMSRLFSAFEQADNSMTRRYGGTGLGLAITRRLADLMGGEAGAESAPGAGSTFWFTAKLKKRGAASAVPATNVVDAEARLRDGYRGQRILVVDDEPINREIAAMLLGDVSLVADTAEHGSEAVALAAKCAYAAILMDMQMPNLNGLDATRQIRLLPGYRHTPIIAMTANAFAENKAECYDAGMDDFLTKPFEPGRFFSTLLRALGRRVE